MPVFIAKVIHYKSEVNKRFAACYRKLQSHGRNKTHMECEKSLLAIQQIRQNSELIECGVLWFYNVTLLTFCVCSSEALTSW
jgi:hypothetical protein